MSHLVLKRVEVEEAAKSRPAGYLAAVLEVSAAAGDSLLIRPEDYAALVRRFSPQRLPDLAGRFAAAVSQEIRAAVAGEAALGTEVIAARLEVCERCEQREATAFGARCRACGCFVKAKSRFRSQSCPLSKWPA